MVFAQTLFTRAVSVAEGYGKRVSLLVVPARDVWSAIVQTANALESAAVVSGLPGLGAAACLPIFATWLALMAAIWLYVLGIARLLSGTFTPFELCLTVLIGASCALGGIVAVRLETKASFARRSIALAAFAALQLGALWLSFRPGISRD